MAASRVLAAALCCLAIAHGECEPLGARHGRWCRPHAHILQQRA